MAGFTLKQLRYFEALARFGHFGHAADACSISQPALSVQIKDLEAAMGVPLLERGPRSVRLTAFGEQFLARAADILRASDELGELARAAQSGLAGRLRIGVIPTIAPYLLPKLLKRLADEYAGLDIHVRETVTPTLIEELSAGRIDAAIVALPVSEPSFAEVPLFDEPIVFVRADSAAGPAPTADALAAMNLLLLEEGHCFRDQALSFCSVGSARDHDRLDGSSLSTLVQMVGAGIGVTLIPQMAVGVEARSAPVEVLTFPNPQPTRTIGMIWRKTNPLAPQLEPIADLVRDVGAP